MICYNIRLLHSISLGHNSWLISCKAKAKPVKQDTMKRMQCNASSFCVRSFPIEQKGGGVHELQIRKISQINFFFLFCFIESVPIYLTQEAKRHSQM